MELTFLGTGAGSGVPAFYCHCAVCMEAAQDWRCRRTRCAICIQGAENLLFDAPPELRSQLMRERIGRIDCLFLTHTHFDHCAGLGDLEIYARYHRKDKLPAVMTHETWAQLKEREGNALEWIDTIFLEPGQMHQRSDVAVAALEVSHSSGCVGYLISSEHGRTAYLPDTGPLPQSTKSQLWRVNNLLLDCTFWGDNWYPDDHLTFEQTIQLAQEVEADTLYLTHLSMHYSQPVTSRQIEECIARYGGRVRLAYDGLIISHGNKHARPSATQPASCITLS